MTVISTVPHPPAWLGSPTPAHRRNIRHLLAMPVVVTVMLSGLYLYVHSVELDSIEKRTLNRAFIIDSVLAHLRITALATILILLIAIPLGIALSRPWARFASPLVLGLANVGQALPAIALLVLLTITLGIGLQVALISAVAYGVLPILRNTIVGLQQIDPDLIDAARGIGMSSGRVLMRVELPLAVPVLMAGVRTTLVLTVGVATLATFVNAGGLGDLIVNGLKLNRLPVQLTGAVLTMVVAFTLDWLARIAEDVLRPRGL
jgi:ABC-type proline/glycine betaine transport system permease subunit